MSQVGSETGMLIPCGSLLRILTVRDPRLVHGYLGFALFSSKYPLVLKPYLLLHHISLRSNDSVGVGIEIYSLGGYSRSRAERSLGPQVGVALAGHDRGCRRKRRTAHIVRPQVQGLALKEKPLEFRMNWLAIV